MNCNRCQLAKFRKMIVPGRGVKPADILFIGEAPGKSENLTGQAFFGKSGRLFNEAIVIATRLAQLNKTPSYYITNVICCRPTDSLGGPNRIPTDAEAWACRPNLEATVSEVQPNMVILLGKVAEKYCKPMFPGAAKLPHPASILRRGGTPSPEFKAFVRDLSALFIKVQED